MNFQAPDNRINNTSRKTQSLFTQKTPKPRKSPFFKITTTIALVIVAILLYKTFASTGVGTASNISLNYDTNTIKQSNGKIECIKDDRILQWHEGLKMWECKKPTDTVFGELDKNNVKINSSGNLECREDNKALIWEDSQWACGDAGSNITTEDGLSINSNDQLSIDSPTCSSTEKLIWDGNNFQCQEDQNEDEQTLSLTDNVLSILNGNDIDLTNLDNSEDLEDHVDDDSIHFTENSIDHGSIAGLTDDDHTQYAVLNGRSGGQTLIGGTDASDNLTLQSTSNATKGKIYFGANSVYDEVNDRLGIGDTTPATALALGGNGVNNGISFNNNDFGIGATASSLNVYVDGFARWKFNVAALFNTTSGGVSMTYNAPQFRASKSENTGMGSPSSGVVGLYSDNSIVASSSATGLNLGVGVQDPNITARTHIKASTSDSSAYALKVDDSSDSSLLSVRNDGLVVASNNLELGGSIKVADDTDTCDSTKVGTLKYYSDANNSYVDMCMQDGASSYVWETITTKTW